MHDWELATTIIVSLLLVVIVLFSVLRPSSRIRLGVFIEREILGTDKDEKRPEPEDAPTLEWPHRDDES